MKAYRAEPDPNRSPGDGYSAPARLPQRVAMRPGAALLEQGELGRRLCTDLCTEIVDNRPALCKLIFVCVLGATPGPDS